MSNSPKVTAETTPVVFPQFAAACGRLVDAEREMAAAKANLGTAIIADLAGALSRMTEDEVRAVARFLYWHPMQPPSQVIADLLGVRVDQMRSLAGSIQIIRSCNRCGKDIAIQQTSRSDSSRRHNRHFCSECCDRHNARVQRQLGIHPDQVRARRERFFVLASMPYSEYLRTPEWKTTRLWAIRRAGQRCQLCNRGDCRLEVHHRTYERRGAEAPEDLISLCDECHEAFHDKLHLDPSSYGKEAVR